MFTTVRAKVILPEGEIYTRKRKKLLKRRTSDIVNLGCMERVGNLSTMRATCVFIYVWLDYIQVFSQSSCLNISQ
jgi:hypothetical protein